MSEAIHKKNVTTMIGVEDTRARSEQGQSNLRAERLCQKSEVEETSEDTKEQVRIGRLLDSLDIAWTQRRARNKDIEGTDSSRKVYRIGLDR